jgi:hypothetical protein
MSVDIDDLRARVETDLDDDTLQRILDAAEKSVERSAGNAVSETQTESDAFGNQWISINRRSTSFTSVKERRRHSSDQVTLSSNDYRKVGPNKVLRLTNGDNPAGYWGKEVEVIYVPEVDVASRDEATLKLCHLSIEYRAYESEKSGDWQGVQKEYNAARRAVLREIREGRSPIV